jgi:hypothetical protein
MTRDELEHAIRAACDVAGESVVIVFGSQAILGQYPDAHEDLRQSMEADIAPGSGRERVARAIDGALGEGSLFHRSHGFYVHGLTIDAAILPSGWKRRIIPVENAGTRGGRGECIEAHDLAASKLVAFREKDRDFVRTLLGERLIRPNKLKLRVGQLPEVAGGTSRILRWIDLTVAELMTAGT